MFKLYNGAPNGALRRHWDAIASMKAEAKALGYHVTWYPAEERWGAGTDVWLPTPYRTVGPLMSTIGGALANIRSDYATRNLL